MAGELGYVVDTAALTDMATAVRAVSQAQGGHRLAELPADVGSYGDDEMYAAFVQFCLRWSDGFDILTRDAAVIADTLDSAVATYRAAEEINGDLFAPCSGGVVE